MQRHYQYGCLTARKRWKIVLGLVAVNLALGAVFMSLLSWWIAGPLERSLATRTLLTDFDLNMFVDLIRHDQGELRVLFSETAGVVTFAVVVWTWLNGVAALAVTADDRARETWSRGFEMLPRLATLAGAVVLLQVSVFGIAIVAAGLVSEWTGSIASEMSEFYVWTAALTFAGLVTFWMSAAHDHARLRCVAAESTAPAALAWGIRFVARDPALLLINALFLGLGVLVWGIYQGAETLIPASSMTAVTIQFIWGQLWMLARVFLRLWLYGTEAAIQVASDSTS